MTLSALATSAKGTGPTERRGEATRGQMVIWETMTAIRRVANSFSVLI